jgi:hypothetical protein
MGLSKVEEYSASHIDVNFFQINVILVDLYGVI